MITLSGVLYTKHDHGKLLEWLKTHDYPKYMAVKKNHTNIGFYLKRIFIIPFLGNKKLGYQYCLNFKMKSEKRDIDFETFIRIIKYNMRQACDVWDSVEVFIGSEMLDVDLKNNQINVLYENKQSWH
jgi:hypothetical protein